MKKTLVKYFTIIGLVTVLSFGAFSQNKSAVRASETFKFGAEVLLSEQIDVLKDKRVGLVTNPTGIDQNLNSVVDMLHNHPEVNLTALYGPEHGVRGNAQAGAYVEFYIDPITNIPVYSIYGKTRKPSPEMLEDVDVLLFDIQDAGVTFYTYIWSMFYVMEAAAENGKEVIILDRPNPLGDYVGGPVLIDDGMSSFVGLKDLAVIHGMTFGELAKYFVGEFGLDLDLKIVEMSNYDRTLKYDDLNVPFVLPSPNMPTTDSVNVYPITGFFESFSNISEGRGTTKPFELIGASFVDSTEYARELNQLNLPGVRFRAAAFTPTSSKLKGELVQGVEVYITNPQSYDPIKTGLHMIETLLKLYPDDVQWRTDKWLGKLTGKAYIEEDLKAGVPVDDIIQKWQSELEDFKVKRDKYLIYNTKNAPDPLVYTIKANDFSLKIDEVANLDNHKIIEKSSASVSVSDGSGATINVIDHDIKPIAGHYSVTVGINEAPDVTKTIAVEVVNNDKVEIVKYSLTAENFAIDDNQVNSLSSETIIEMAKAQATSSDNSEAAIVISENNIVEEEGDYSVLFSIAQDPMVTKEISVTVRKTEVKPPVAYTINAEDFSLSEDEAKTINDTVIIEKAKVNVSSSDGSKVNVFVKEHTIKNEVGTYSVALAIAEDPNKEVTVNATVTRLQDSNKVEKNEVELSKGQLPSTGIESSTKLTMAGSALTLLGVCFYKRKSD